MPQCFVQSIYCFNWPVITSKCHSLHPAEVINHIYSTAYRPKYRASFSLGYSEQAVVPGKKAMVYSTFSDVKLEACIRGGIDLGSRGKPPSMVV